VVRGLTMSKSKIQKRTLEEFPIRERHTVSGLRAGDICFPCECRILEIGGEDGVTLAWCDCALPDDHHEMELL
jgi:hypothetical protein